MNLLYDTQYNIYTYILTSAKFRGQNIEGW